MTEKTLILWDTETTGFPKAGAPIEEQPHIIEFAAIKVNRAFEEVGRLDFLCDPGVPISEKITEVTGITQEDVDGKLSFAEHYDDVAYFFDGANMMMTHNMPFDRRMLELELERIGDDADFIWPKHQRCSMRLTNSIQGKWIKMGVLYKHVTGKKLKNAHRAIADVEGLVVCAKWMREKEMF